MKTEDKKMVLALVFVTAAFFPASLQSQTQFSPAATSPASGGSTSTTHGGRGYISGGERGSVVQVVRDAEVQADLDLNPEQRQQVSEILLRVQAKERELFDDSRRQLQARLEDARARSRQRMERLEE